MKLDPLPPVQRLLAGSPLRRRGIALALGALLAVLLAAALTILVLVLKDWQTTAIVAFLRSLAAVSVLSLVPAALLAWLDRREREWPWLLALAFLWGGLIAAGLSMELNDRLAHLLRAGFGLAPDLTGTDEGEALVSALLAAPLVEEALKALGIVLLFWGLRAEFDNQRDGFVYGAMVGLGFTWIETSLYVVGTWLELGPKAWAMQLGWRYALFGLSGHALYSGLFGAGLGLSRQTGRPWPRRLAPALAFLVAVAAHIADNLASLYLGSLDFTPDWNVIQVWLAASLWQGFFLLPFLVLAAALLWRGGLTERRVIREELAAEGPDILTPAERESLLGPRPFRNRPLAAGPPAVTRRLARAQHELAFRRRALRRQGEDPEEDPLVQAWRDDIRRLRQELVAAANSSGHTAREPPAG